MFFGFKRSDSVSQILLELGLPSFDAILHNSRIIFWRTWCKYTGVTYLSATAVFLIVLLYCTAS